MGRPRAGDAMSSGIRGERYVTIIGSKRRWVTTGEARKWPRCSRCRRPHESDSPTAPRLCYGCWWDGWRFKDGHEWWRERDYRAKIGDQVPYSNAWLFNRPAKWPRNRSSSSMAEPRFRKPEVVVRSHPGASR